MKYLGDRRAADLCAPLEHGDFAAVHCEIGRGDEAIVTAADHDDVRILLLPGEGGAKGRMRVRPRYTSNRTPCASGSLAE